MYYTGGRLTTSECPANGVVAMVGGIVVGSLLNGFGLNAILY
jgi:hypothetical protein